VGGSGLVVVVPNEPLGHGGSNGVSYVMWLWLWRWQWLFEWRRKKNEKNVVVGLVDVNRVDMGRWVAVVWW
jgi:hypothetical protein